MTQGDPDSPVRGPDRESTMTEKESNSDKARGEKRGVLSTGRARKLGRTADADAAEDDGEEESEA